MRARITSEKSWRLQQSTRQMQQDCKSHSQIVRIYFAFLFELRSAEVFIQYYCSCFFRKVSKYKNKSLYFFTGGGGLRPYLASVVSYCESSPCSVTGMSVEDGDGDRPGVAEQHLLPGWWPHSSQASSSSEQWDGLTSLHITSHHFTSH